MERFSIRIKSAIKSSTRLQSLVVGLSQWRKMKFPGRKNHKFITNFIRTSVDWFRKLFKHEFLINSIIIALPSSSNLTPIPEITFEIVRCCGTLNIGPWISRRNDNWQVLRRLWCHVYGQDKKKWNPRWDHISNMFKENSQNDVTVRQNKTIFRKDSTEQISTEQIRGPGQTFQHCQTYCLTVYS